MTSQPRDCYAKNVSRFRPAEIGVEGVSEAMTGVVEVDAREEGDPIRSLSGQYGLHPFV
jgi:hypothetical protein